MSELSYVSLLFFSLENAVIGAGSVSKVPCPQTPSTYTLSNSALAFWKSDFFAVKQFGWELLTLQEASASKYLCLLKGGALLYVSCLEICLAGSRNDICIECNQTCRCKFSLHYNRNIIFIRSIEIIISVFIISFPQSLHSRPCPKMRQMRLKGPYKLIWVTNASLLSY